MAPVALLRLRVGHVLDSRDEAPGGAPRDHPHWLRSRPRAPALRCPLRSGARVYWGCCLFFRCSEVISRTARAPGLTPSPGSLGRIPPLLVLVNALAMVAIRQHRGRWAHLAVAPFRF